MRKSFVQCLFPDFDFWSCIQRCCPHSTIRVRKILKLGSLSQRRCGFVSINLYRSVFSVWICFIHGMLLQQVMRSTFYRTTSDGVRVHDLNGCANRLFNAFPGFDFWSCIQRCSPHFAVRVRKCLKLGSVSQRRCDFVSIYLYTRASFVILEVGRKR